jgi:hypothetical protein
MRRLILLLSIAFLGISAFALAPHAHAEEWCFDDPIVSVNGNLMDIRVTMPLGNLLTMRSTTVTVVVPRNVPGAVILPDISAFPMTTRVSPTGPTWLGFGPIPVTVNVLVNAGSRYQTSVVATPVLNLSNLLASPKSGSGTTNTPFSLSMTLGR